MSSILVKISLGPDGNQIVELGVNIQMQGVFRNGIVEKLGHRKMSKKFIDGVCTALVKQIQPQLRAAIKQEHHFYEHPEDIPPPPDEKAPPLNHALLAKKPANGKDENPVAEPRQELKALVAIPDGVGESDGDVGEGSEGDPGVSGSDQEPDHSD